nr:MAG TPA: hypothetical protein [Bacteriophage sp.]
MRCFIPLPLLFNLNLSLLYITGPPIRGLLYA